MAEQNKFEKIFDFGELGSIEHADFEDIIDDLDDGIKVDLTAVARA